jgi:hypothetical protein
METAVRTETLTTTRGSGFRCDGCRQPITREQVECRCGGARLHQWCHYAQTLVKGAADSAEVVVEVISSG